MPEITIKISMGSEGVSVTRDQVESDERTFFAPPQDVSEENTEGITGEGFYIPPVPEEEEYLEEELSVPPPPETGGDGEDQEFVIPPLPEDDNGG